MPAELVRQAARRLRLAAWGLGLFFAGGILFNNLIEAAGWYAFSNLALKNVVAASMVALSAAVVWFAHSGRVGPARLLRVSLGFEVLVALGASIHDHLEPLQAGVPGGGSTRRPATKTPRTRIRRNSPGPAASGSPSRMVKVAAAPGSSRASSPIARAAPVVNRASACAAVSDSAGRNPARSRAQAMPHRGWGGSTGQSEPPASGMPASASVRKL